MKYIDLNKNFKESSSKILQRMPLFLVSLMKKVVMQNELNTVLNKTANNIGVDFLHAIIKEFNITPQIEGLENLPENGRCFFVSNHPFGIIDGLILTKTVSDKYGTFKAIGNDAFMLIPQMHPVTAVVNVYGQTSKEYVLALEKVYASDLPITHFPAGEVSRPYNGKVQDTVWQKSMITKAISHKRDIVPFHMYGSNSKLFHFINHARKLIGIKANLELALLPREMFNKRNKTIKAKIGKPIPWQRFDKSKSHKEWAQEVRDYVYRMKDNDADF
ncbi:MAG: glycerol acyltransferase [Bacteroidota bacterium]